MKIKGDVGGRGWLNSGTGPTGWPAVEVRQQPAAKHDRELLSDREAAFLLADGSWALVDRTRGLAIRAGDTDRTALVHPFLAAVAIAFAHWADRLVVHGGAFVVDGRAWMLLGPKGTGKSTMLAALSARDVPIASDDLAVVERGRLLCGPRAVDLRRDAARELGVEGLEPVRGGSRARLHLDPVPAALPLAGVVRLVQGERRGLRALRAEERLQGLTDADETIVSDARPESLLDLAALPTFELTVLRSFRRLPDAVDELLSAVGGEPQGL